MPEQKKNDLAVIKIDKKTLDEALKRKMIDKHLDDVLDLKKAILKTRNLLSKLEKFDEEIENGDWSAVEKYKKLKSRISNDLSIEDES